MSTDPENSLDPFEWADHYEEDLAADLDDDTYTWREFGAIIGQRLHTARKAKRYSQQQVASRANIAAFTYQKLEKGQARAGVALNPRLSTLVALCRALDLSLDELIPEEWPRQVPTVERKPR